MPTQSSHLNPTVIAAAGLIAALSLSPRAAHAQDARCPQDDPAVAGVSVTVDAAAASVEVDPTSVVVYLDAGSDQPKRVCWSITGLGDGMQLRLEDKEDDSADYFPGLQRTATSRAPYLNSGNPARLGTWSYSVVVRDGSGAVIAELDPEVIVRGGGGR